MASLRSGFAISIALIAVVSAVPAYAQDGRIGGVVRDASGAGVPGAALTITNQATNAAQAATTSADGSYSVNVPPGVYSVAAFLKGFARQTQRGIRVDAGASVTVDLALETRLEEEITVTAMKTRGETVQNTPFSVAAPSEEVLRSRGVDNIEDLATNVGGFSIQNLGPGQSQVTMRGISAGQIVRDQPGVKEQVGVYLDESPISLSLFTPDLDLFDVSRVEVLRGPQGTIFGSGSLSGTVRYITNQPALRAKEWFGEFGGYTLTDGNQGGNAKIGLNAPLGDKAALRVAGYYNRLAGWIDGVQPNLSVQKDINTGYRTGGRAAVSIAPSDRLIITPRFVYQKAKADAWNRVDIFNILANPFTTTRPAVTPGPRQVFTQLDEVFTDKFALGDLNINYNFGNVGLTSITSYTHRDLLSIPDTTSLSAFFLAAVFGVPESVYTLDGPLIDATTAKVFTQELRLSGTKDRVRWVAGGFYSRTNRDYGQNLSISGFEDATGIPTRGLRAPKDSLFWSELGYKLDQFALFGEATVSVSDAFSVTGGLRYYNFNEDKEQIFDGIFGSPNLGVSLASQPGSTDADGFAPRLILSFKLSDTTNLNTQVSRGFRLGGINDPLNEPICTPQDLATFGGRGAWTDETVWNYEVGSKSRIFGNRGSFNIAAFSMDIRDLQATVTAGSCSSRLIFNVPKARSQGFETEFDFAPSRNFDFALSASFTDSELRSTVPPTSATGIVEGRRLPTVPKFQFAAAATYQWEMGDGLEGYVTSTYRHVGDRFTQVNDEDLGTLTMTPLIGGPLTATTFRYDPKVPAYDLVNLRVGIRREKWDLSLYANNLTDKDAVLAFDREAGTLARIFHLVNQPRSIGAEIRIRN